MRDVAAPLPMVLIGDMLGVAPEDRDDLLRWSDDMVSSQSGNATEEQFLSAMHAMEEYTEFCTHAVAQRQEHPTDDLMSVLVHAEVDGDRLEPLDVLHESAATTLQPRLDPLRDARHKRRRGDRSDQLNGTGERSFPSHFAVPPGTGRRRRGA